MTMLPVRRKLKTAFFAEYVGRITETGHFKYRIEYQAGRYFNVVASPTLTEKGLRNEARKQGVPDYVVDNLYFDDDHVREIRQP